MNTDRLRFSKDILTPRKDIADKNPELQRSVLTESQRFKRIEAVFLASDGGYSDMVEAADEVGHMVRQTLSFGSQTLRDPRLWRKDHRTNTLQTNCYGHTIIASELMAAIGIEHYVSFVNTHAFVVVLNREGRQAHMVDCPTKDLFLDIDNAIAGQWPLSQFEENPEKSFATNMIDTTAILSRVTRKRPAQVVSENEWLGQNARKTFSLDRDTIEAPLLIMRTYRADEGRSMLEHYGLLLQYTVSGQLGSAVDQLRRLEGTYPDVERSNDLYLARKLRGMLLGKKMYSEMEDVARIVDASLSKFGSDQDRTPNKYFLLDTLRMIAFANRDAEVLRSVAAAYRIEFGDDSLTIGKSKRAQQLAARLEK